MDISYFGAKKISPKNITEMTKIRFEINNIRTLNELFSQK